MKGGARKKQKPTTGQKALLDAIWHRYGGVGAVAHKLGVHIQAPVNWRLRGRVPLKFCYSVAEALDLTECQMWGLNYIDLFTFYPTKAPPWEDVIKCFEFSPDVFKTIINLKAPKIPSLS